MRKVVVLSHRDIKHNEGGGASLYVHEIFKRLTTRYDVTIISTARRGLPTRDRIDGIAIVRIPFPRLSRFVLPMSLLTRLTGHADIVIDNGDIAIPWLTPAYVHKPLVSIIYQIVGNIFDYELPSPFSTLARKAEPWIYKAYKHTKIVACSPSTKDDLVKFGIPNENVFVVIPGIDESLRNYVPSGEKFSNPTIVCISRFKRYKGLHYAVRAMNHILAKIPTANLVVVGSGDDSEIKSEISKLGLESNVKVIRRPPHVWNREKIALLSSAHLALVPSVREGYGIVVIEANACGTVAVGWRVPGLQDSIRDGETGILVPFGNVEALGEQLSILLQDHKRRIMMAASAKEWSRTHSWGRAAEEFSDAIDSVISERN